MIYAIVNQPSAPIRKEASLCSPLEDEAVYGMKVQVLYQCGEWYYIRTHYQIEGYIPASSLLLDSKWVDEWDCCRKSIITKGFADILAESKYQSGILITLPRSSLVIAESGGEFPGYVRVVLADRRSGYVRLDFLKESGHAGYEDCFGKLRKGGLAAAGWYVTECLRQTEDNFRASLVNTAISYLGTQYRWGGRTGMGIDCSGLCFTVYLLNGFIIYRNSSMQEGFPMHEIAFTDKKPGDLLYFPGHIAMYIGRQKYIHATGREGAGGVVINSLHVNDADYRQDLFRSLYAVGSIFE